jgi:Flp pilus assembly protein TadG
MRRDKSSAAQSRRRLRSNRAGNVAVITALVMIPLTFALGMAFDFTLSQSRKDKLDGIADVAALGGVTPAQMSAPAGAAAAQSKKLFNGQAALVGGIASANPTVTATDATIGTSVTRTVVVTYTAQSQNVFAALLGMPTMSISGSSTAKSSTAPNIDFYLLLDTSPSMEIAATSAGITAMQNATQQESDTGAGWTSPPNGNGCAFGCHQSNPADLTSSTSCVPHIDPATGHSTTQCQFLTQSYQKIGCSVGGAYADGTAFAAGSAFPESGRDNYDLSRCLGVTLRIDLLNTAAQNLMTSASSMAASYKTTYRMALYLTDFNQANAANDLNLYALQPLTSNLALAKTQAAAIGSLEMYQNNHLVSGDANQDMDTYLDTDITAMNGLLPTPGGGTNNAGDKPQEVLFIVTDGMNDMTPTRTYAPMDWSGDNCAAIKARGVRIAVLYTTYEPLNESWYLNQVVPAMPKGLPPKLPSGTPVGSDPMALAAQQCASTGLYYEVSTDGDISAALQALFQKVVSTARLTQ